MGVKAKPIGERVLIEPAAAEAKSAGGIIIPDTAKEKPKRGTVIAIGSGEHKFTVKVGDNVLYGQYSGTEVKMDGKEYLIMKENEILLIVK